LRRLEEFEQISSELCRFEGAVSWVAGAVENAVASGLKHGLGDMVEERGLLDSGGERLESLGCSRTPW
jgi:predicted HD phosphohydrolase